MDIKKLILIIIFYFNIYCQENLLITEVAVAQNYAKDWVELFVLSDIDFLNLKNLSIEYIDYNTTKILSFKDLILYDTGKVDKGKFILVYINQPQTYCGFDNDLNFIIKTTFSFRSTAGFYSSNAIVAIKEGNFYIDVICYSNNQNLTYPNLVTKLSQFISNSDWIVNLEFDNTYGTKFCVDSSKVDNNITLQRIRNVNGLPFDSNTKDDWYISYKTESYGYKEFLNTTLKIVEVDKNTNPFCPEDKNNSFVRINFNIEDPDAEKTCIIYDIAGNEVIKLLDKNFYLGKNSLEYFSLKSGSIIWDGKDKTQIKRVPSGIYIVYFEAYNPKTTKKYFGKDVIVVGQK